MIIMGAAGMTLITLAILENKGKLSINTNKLLIIMWITGLLAGWWGMNEIVNIFLK